MRFFKSKYPVIRRRTKVSWLGKAISVLLAIAMTCIVAGCDKKDSLPVDDSSNTLQGVSENESNTSLEQSSNPTEFDFDDALKNITLFGSKISLPCTITDFGEDFSLSEGYVAVFDDIASCGILYQGKNIGEVSMTGYKDGDNLNDKQIISMSLGFIETYDGISDSLKEELYESRGLYYGLIEVDFAGFSFESTEDEVESVFGEAYKRDDNSARYKFYSDDGSLGAEIQFYKGKVKRITINI